ncbi:hypothetical protein Q8A73_022771 [Channa argus]|nr:hypothetical protein Q8A73_022771 [Channa argus]
MFNWDQIRSQRWFQRGSGDVWRLHRQKAASIRTPHDPDLKTHMSALGSLHLQPSALLLRGFLTLLSVQRKHKCPGVHSTQRSPDCLSLHGSHAVFKCSSRPEFS